MSLARALLALACAAPLLAARARPPLDGLLCVSKFLGVTTNYVLELPEVSIHRFDRQARIDIPNDCEQQGMAPRGQLVIACDADSPPEIKADRFTPITVRRTGSLYTAAPIYINQYCSY